MNRQDTLNELNSFHGYWDFVVIGGGATGLGVALDAASRGYKTLLLDQHDFAKGTSSRSTKLVHGGVRYLQQGNISLVLEALHERGLLIQNAPHLVTHQSFIVPNYDWWEGPFYGVGMKVYDLLAGKLGLSPSKNLSKEETLAQIPTIEPKGLRGGVRYYDGQFDDARLAINLAQSIVDAGGYVINYMKVVALRKNGDMVQGVCAVDQFSGIEHEIAARVVVNATGVFTDSILNMDDKNHKPIVSPSQGVHIVLDKKFLPGKAAIMVPQTDDGRVLFAVPWHDKVIVGTTDTPVENPTLEPKALDEEIEFIMTHAARYLSKDPNKSDVLSVFAGLRPLVKAGDGTKTAELSRDHTLLISESGLVTITGGKWTTYRKMAEDTVDKAALVAGLNVRPCITRDLKIHGWLNHVDLDDPRYHYGSDLFAIKRRIKKEPNLGEKLHDQLEVLKADVVWAVEKEMAQTVEDVLSRRSRSLLLNAKASVEIAADVASIMAGVLGKDEGWIKNQVADYTTLAKDYQLK